MTGQKRWLELLFGLNMWFGISLGDWLKLLCKYPFAVKPERISRVFTATGASIVNSMAGFLEKACYAKEVAETELVAPPIFVLGYWRTGTSHLHNLLSQDKRFTFPTTYTCMFPHHFLLTENVGKKLLSRLIPEKRPMDNMRLSWDLPQEDEVALALLGGLSPYLDFAFPNTPETHHRFLDFNDATNSERELFKQLIIHFVRKHTFRSHKRVVLKSPAHTYRVKLLVDAFPRAKFIHIYRDPITVFASAVHMFTIVRDQVGLTTPDNSRLEQRIIEDMLLCYEQIREDQAILAPEQFHEIRFEDLEKQPIKELGNIYDRLNLGGFESVKPRLEAYLASVSNYKKNRYDVSPEKRRQLTEKFAPILKTYGYPINALI